MLSHTSRPVVFSVGKITTLTVRGSGAAAPRAGERTNVNRTRRTAPALQTLRILMGQGSLPASDGRRRQKF